MTPVTELISVRHTDLYIDGGWRPAADEQRIDVTDPATAEVIATVASPPAPDALNAGGVAARGRAAAAGARRDAAQDVRVDDARSGQAGRADGARERKDPGRGAR